MKKDFDVFLAYNSKENAHEISEGLKRFGLKPWIDIEQLKEEQLLQNTLSQVIARVKFVAIIVSSEKLENWQPELKLLVDECKKQEISVIPVLLSGVNKLPQELSIPENLDCVSSIVNLKKTTSDILNDFEERLKGKPLSLFTKLLINLFIIVFLFFSFLKINVVWPCVRPEISALSLTIILWFFLYPFCRLFNKHISKVFDTIKLGIVDVRIKELTLRLESIDLCKRLSDLNLWVLSSILSAIVWLLFLSPFFLLFPLDEEMPTIQKFSIHYLDLGFSDEQFFTSDSMIEIVENQPAKIIAEKSGASFSDQAKLRCTWTSSRKGRLESLSGCSVLYKSPLGETFDTLKIQIQSPCRTQEVHINLSVKIVKD